ncbi:MAG: hypothetical protein ABIO36_07710, partial [Pyrinomonadaceae bacterium]
MRKSVESYFAVNRRVFLLLGVVLSLAAFGVINWRVNAQSGLADQNDRGVISGRSYQNDTSIPLREMKFEPYLGKEMDREANENPKIPHSQHKNKPDEAIQDKTASLIQLLAPNIPGPSLTFDGIVFPGVGCNCAPPDTVGEVGQTQYVQMVNEGLQVFNKSTGASIFGPVGIATIWSGFGGVCQTNGSGDPIVLYDQLANRWVITQFAGTSVPTDECIAVSTTNDASGSYYRYAFHLGSNFFDYPHLAVWPDGYYMSDNVFNAAGTAFLGPQPFAFDRAKMLLGQPATFVSPGVTGGPNENSYLPSDLDGSTLPPAGSPATFVEVPFGSSYRVFHFHADFATPSNTTFSLFASPAAAGFTEICPTSRSCVPQSGQTTTSKLDAVGDRLMYRLATRFIGGHESTVGNFTVSAGGVAGVRWFELRNVTSGPVTVFQESTYQPDTTWRWMGSAGMDKDGNIAVGFSASSASIFPQIRYAGRLAGDPINTLAQGETTMFAGTGSQSGTGNRWGDYSSLTIDPVDDCTFWYTQEYYQTSGTFNWRTRVGSFKFTTCGGSPTPTPTPTATPTPTPTATPTPTPTATPTPTPTPTPTELITNGGFEGSVSPWVSSGNGAFYTANDINAHGGTGYVYFGVNNRATGQTYQTVSIPTTASGTMSFWLNVTSNEGATADDLLFVELRNTAGTLLATLATYSNLDNGAIGVYSQKSFDLSAYRGQTVRIQFRVTTDKSRPTT